MKHYEYFYYYCTCTTLLVNTNKAGMPIYIGNGKVKFFECFAKDILEADKLLEKFLETKINWNKQPFTQVVCIF